MKTTIEIADSLLVEAKRIAAREGTTLRALVEQGLRRALSERRRKSAFRLRRATFKGKGLQPGVKDLSWERLHDLAYEGPRRVMGVAILSTPYTSGEFLA